jgi:hypothetical protein
MNKNVKSVTQGVAAGLIVFAVGATALVWLFILYINNH